MKIFPDSIRDRNYRIAGAGRLWVCIQKIMCISPFLQIDYKCIEWRLSLFSVKAEASRKSRFYYLIFVLSFFCRFAIKRMAIRFYWKSAQRPTSCFFGSQIKAFRKNKMDSAINMSWLMFVYFKVFCNLHPVNCWSPFASLKFTSWNLI